jgi:hypothetical protein
MFVTEDLKKFQKAEIPAGFDKYSLKRSLNQLKT